MGQCCSRAEPNKHDDSKKIVAKPEVRRPTQEVIAAPDNERQAVMDKYTDMLLEKANQIFDSEPQSVEGFLRNPADLLARLRNDTRYKAKPLIQDAFEAYDNKPPDHMLSVEESTNFINAYCKSMETFAEKMYISGFKHISKKVDPQEAKRVSSTFARNGVELRAKWHTSCDRNGDGQLRLSEVAQAFMGNTAGEAEVLLASCLAQEFGSVIGDAV
eukprot:TRINITY_DN28396_c1_g2_i1.p1 TRINITY_DN28396_c1_g2~~TRINITY_DN28396_c1_g2_i1.p1  ORF type:complete len:232 (+),score=77.40 TRINITY_DN28396_c1_g2_i1:50-697(+)